MLLKRSVADERSIPSRCAVAVKQVAAALAKVKPIWVAYELNLWWGETSSARSETKQKNVSLFKWLQIWQGEGGGLVSSAEFALIVARFPGTVFNTHFVVSVVDVAGDAQNLRDRKCEVREEGTGTAAGDR